MSISADVELGSERASIELEAIEAIVKTASKAKFFIEFHSRCLEGIFCAVINVSFANLFPFEMSGGHMINVKVLSPPSV